MARRGSTSTQAEIEKAPERCTLTWQKSGEPGDESYRAGWGRADYSIYKARKSGYMVIYTVPPGREEILLKDGAEQHWPDDTTIASLSAAKRAARLHCARVAGRTPKPKSKSSSGKSAGRKPGTAKTRTKVPMTSKSQKTSKLDAVRKHQLMPQALRKKMPALYSQDGASDPMVHAKFFSPYSGMVWLLTEFDGDDTLFGWGDLGMGGAELGYISLSELENSNRDGLPMVERDLYFGAKPLSEAKAQEYRTRSTGDAERPYEPPRLDRRATFPRDETKAKAKSSKMNVGDAVSFDIPSTAFRMQKFGNGVISKMGSTKAQEVVDSTGSLIKAKAIVLVDIDNGAREYPMHPSVLTKGKEKKWAKVNEPSKWARPLTSSTSQRPHKKWPKGTVVIYSVLSEDDRAATLTEIKAELRALRDGQSINSDLAESLRDHKFVSYDRANGWTLLAKGKRKLGVTTASKKKAPKKKPAMKEEKATYLSFEDTEQFNKAVVRLLGSMDAPTTTTIDAGSLQIRIPMAKTTAGVQKLVKGLRSGKDRAKFRVHNPHPPREYKSDGKGAGKLGEKIKRYRTKRDMSRSDLAKVMLIESSTLGQIERGAIKCPPYARLDRAADALGVKTSTLTAAAVCDYRTKRAPKKPKKKANRATPVAKGRCARKGSISAKTRGELPAKAFGLPATRSYPMFKMGGDGKLVPSASHAGNAKARARGQLDKGNLSRKDYDRIVRKANKVLGQCSAPVRRAKTKAKKSARAKARRLCPADQRKILNAAVREMMK